MEPRYYLRCLSEPTLLGPDGQPVKFRVRKHFALLIYLAIHGRTAQRREQLAELLWGSAPPGEARHSLATALSAIRGKLGRAALETTRDTVRFTHPHLTTDLDRLAAGDLFASEDRPMLEVAGFLDGLEVADAAEFMLWKEGQHARWLPEIHAALIQLMDRCRRTGDSRQIEVLADRMLVLDELSEAGIRAKMEARAFAGDRLTALRVFETWQRRLLAELQAEPSALVAGMAMRLRRRGWERPVADPIASVPTDRWKNRPFIGRRNEYRVLYEGWEATQRGEPRHVLLLGESGIGKSTLAERLTTAAGLEGASAARVQCYEPEQGIPYAAVTSLILQLLDRPGASATPPEALAELSRTVPEVRRRFPSIPPAVESEGEASRIRLTEAFHELLTAVAEEHPVILIIDDLHFTDDASLAVLHLVLRKSRRQPLQVVLLTRSEELLKSPSAARLRENATALGFAVLEVPPLTEDETEELIRSLVPAEGPQPGPTVRRRLLQGSAGYPMVAELLVQDWLEHGDRCLALSVTAMTTELAPQAGSAAAYHAIVDRVMRSLDPTTRNVLSLASILGSRLNDVSKYALLDLTMGQTMASLARLTDLRLLRDGAHGLEFVNELVRGQVYTATPKSLRKSLHGSIANLLLADPA
ncbi:MAG TPA: AAA family ATPase, partial [Gemmatimonadales bacterium]|nr:AAA family ATPase [Gemmatimonadales bacterium]